MNSGPMGLGIKESIIASISLIESSSIVHPKGARKIIELPGASRSPQGNIVFTFIKNPPYRKLKYVLRETFGGKFSKLFNSAEIIIIDGFLKLGIKISYVVSCKLRVSLQFAAQKSEVVPFFRQHFCFLKCIPTNA